MGISFGPKAPMQASYASFEEESTFSKMSTKKMVKYGILAAVGLVAVCVGLSFMVGSSDLATPVARANTGRISRNTRVNVGAGGAGSFLAPGGPFEPAQIAYRVMGATMLHEALRGYLIARYRKLEKLNPQRWGKPETLQRAENELNMGQVPTDIPEE